MRTTSTKHLSFIEESTKNPDAGNLSAKLFQLYENISKYIRKYLSRVND